MRGSWLTWLVAVAIMVCPHIVLAGNQEMAQEIARSLKDSGQLTGYKIGIRYVDGTAWLRGTVKEEQQKQIAEEIASQVPGVKKVVNELTVASSSTQAESETALQPMFDAFAPEHVNTGLSSSGAYQLSGPTMVAHPRVQQADALASVFPTEAAMPTAATVVEGPTLAVPDMPEVTQTPTQAVSKAAMVTSDAAPRPMAPMPIAYAQPNANQLQGGLPVAVQPLGRPLPMYAGAPGAAAPARYDQPNMPNYAWPSYAAYPNYAAVTYPKQYSATAWPYIGPFYPYPQVPLGWRKVTLEWHDGWWCLDFDDGATKGPFSGLFRAVRGH